MNALRIFALAAASAFLIAPSAAAQKPAKDDPAKAMTERINAIRADHGLPALRVAPKLMRSSRAYARRLARTGDFSHGSSYRATGFRQSGEMLAYDLDRKLRLSGPIRMWLQSPMHRGLMLSSTFKYVGASPSRARGAAGQKTVWVVHLGAH